MDMHQILAILKWLKILSFRNVCDTLDKFSNGSPCRVFIGSDERSGKKGAGAAEIVSIEPRPPTELHNSTATSLPVTLPPTTEDSATYH